MPSPSRAELEHWYRQAEAALSARDYPRAHRLCMGMLSLAPSFAGALFLLGMIAVEHRNFAKAAEILERAIQYDERDARCHAQLGRCLIALLRPQQAEQAAQRALALAPEDALTLDTIGVVFSHVGAHERALQLFELAVARAPQQAAYHYNLGTSLQFCGRFSAAEQALRRALQLDGNLARAWTALAQVIRGPLPEDDVRSLQQGLASATDVDARLHLCHALAKHYEELGQFAEAFRTLEHGKRAKRQALGPASRLDAELFAAARLAPTHQAGAPEQSSEEPIFIIGMPRTGTTLLERILGAHPQVFAAGELTNFALEVKRATHTTSRLVLDAETLSAAANIDLRCLGTQYIQSTRPRTGHTRRFIDKQPLNFFFAGLIHTALPRARIICLRRNALDTCLANYRQMFAGSFPYYHYAYDLLDTGRYYLQFDALLRHWRATLGEHYCEVWYESLVLDTAGTARRLLEFCGLPWHPACLEFHRSEPAVATASAVQVRQPVYRSSLQRWRHYQRELRPLRELLRASAKDRSQGETAFT